MPVRSNDFQRLITFIEAHLAPSGAKVTASALLYDRHAGIEREVDILVEYNMGIRSFRTGIECRDRSRPADVTWVEQAFQEHRDLGLDRTVLVARSGFTKTAVRKARQLGVEALTIDEATEIGFPSFNLQVLQPPRIVGLSIRLGPNASLTEPTRMPLEGATLQNAVGQSLGSVSDFAKQRLNDNELREYIRDQIWSRKDLTVDVAILPREPTYVVDASDSRYEVSEIDIVVIQPTKYVTVEMIPATYSGKDIAYGFGELDSVPFQIHAIRDDGSDQFHVFMAYPPEFKELVDIPSVRSSVYSLLQERYGHDMTPTRREGNQAE